MKDLTSEGYSLDGSIYITFWKRQNYRDRRPISGCQEVRVREGLTGMGNEGVFGVVGTHCVCRNSNNYRVQKWISVDYLTWKGQRALKMRPRKDNGIKNKQNWVWLSFWAGLLANRQESPRAWLASSRSSFDLRTPAYKAAHGRPRVVGLPLSPRGLARVSSVRMYLNNVFFLHPGWKRKALAEHLE